MKKYSAEITRVLSSLYNFFDCEEGWSREELISEYIYEIQKEFSQESSYAADEIELVWGDKVLNMTLQDFLDSFYEKVLEGVKNVIESEME